MSLDKRSLDEIIKAVGKKFEPADLDRSALRRAIDESEKRAEIISAHRRGARARKLLKRLKQVRETAEQLAVLLNTKDDASDLIQELCGEWPKAMVSRLIVYVEALEQVLSDGKPSMRGIPMQMSGSPAWNCRVYSKNIFTESPVARETRPAKLAAPVYVSSKPPCANWASPTIRASILRAMTRLRALQIKPPRLFGKITPVSRFELDKTDQEIFFHPILDALQSPLNHSLSRAQCARSPDHPGT